MARVPSQPPVPADSQAGTIARCEPAKAVRLLIESQAERLAKMLPRHITPFKVAEIVSLIVYKTPKLQQCNPHSVLMAVMEGSGLGLDFNTKLNEAWLVPRWNKAAGGQVCQFEPGYQGLRKLAMRSGEVAFIQARLVHAGDRFEYYYDPELHFLHRPHLGPDRGAIERVYAYAKLRSGDPILEVMKVDDIEKIRQCSQSADSGPWISHWDQMACKTLIKRICKTLPRSVELDTAIAFDDRQYEWEDAAGRPVRVVSAPPGARFASRSAALAHALPVPRPEPSFTPGVTQPLYSEEDDDPEGTYPLPAAEPGPDEAPAEGDRSEGT